MFLDLHDLQTITTINVLLTLGTMEKTWNWLKSKLIEKKNGIILEKNDSDSFESVQDFIESTEHNFYTSVIYYQAFPQENAVDFLNTLKSELTAKLNLPEFESSERLGEIIKAAKLQMIIIDRCYLHPLDALQSLIDFFSIHQVAVILVGSQSKMAIAKVLDLPTVSQWDKLVVCDECKTIPKLN